MLHLLLVTFNCGTFIICHISFVCCTIILFFKGSDSFQALSKSKRKCEQMKKEIKDVQATHMKRLSALEGSLRSVMLASVDKGQPPLAPGEKLAIELIDLEALGLPDLLSAKECTSPSAGQQPSPPPPNAMMTIINLRLADECAGRFTPLLTSNIV
jgi:hypothetical protein